MKWSAKEKGEITDTVVPLLPSPECLGPRDALVCKTEAGIMQGNDVMVCKREGGLGGGCNTAVEAFCHISLPLFKHKSQLATKPLKMKLLSGT